MQNKKGDLGLVKMIVSIIVVGSALLWGLLTIPSPLNNGEGYNNNEIVESLDKLQVPPLLEYEIVGGIKNFDINVQNGQYEFVKGVKSDTYGYNGDILGPTIKFSYGDNVKIHVNNKLDEQTTTHWHGGLVPGDSDGGVHNIISPNSTWSAEFDVIQEAATLWYHPHQHEETARQVYAGLGGFILIEDDNSKTLPIPQEYGIDDFPIILQSKNIDSSGKMIDYKTSRIDQPHDFSGNTLLVNAQIKPFVDVTTNLIRLRILNGSNDDEYIVSLSNRDEFNVIASDGGFYDEPIKVLSLEVPIAKRYEVLIDLTNNRGESVWLNVNGEKQLEIKIPETLSDKYKIPNKLNNLVYPEPYTKIDREFDLKLLSRVETNIYGINGRLFDIERIDFEVKNDNIEYWKIKNIKDGTDEGHPFHVHATQFYVMEFNGEKPSDLLRGRHDTVFLAPGDEIVIGVPFDKSLDGVYMYHCHILEHEDAGMMGQFNLIK